MSLQKASTLRRNLERKRAPTAAKCLVLTAFALLARGRPHSLRRVRSLPPTQWLTLCSIGAVRCRIEELRSSCYAHGGLRPYPSRAKCPVEHAATGTCQDSHRKRPLTLLHEHREDSSTLGGRL